MFELALSILLTYLIGSLNSSLILGKINNYDVRKHGSGNAGATNTFRMHGKIQGTIVFCFDCLKGFLAIKLSESLKEIIKTDSSYFIERNTVTQQLLLWGQGEIHLRVALSKIKNKNNLHKTILFSPSAASFDSFKNFEERGDYFNFLLKKLKIEKTINAIQ